MSRASRALKNPGVLMTVLGSGMALAGLLAARGSLRLPVGGSTRQSSKVGAEADRTGGPTPAFLEKVVIARSGGEVALHLHDHGGLPGFDGGIDGPVVDRYEWDLPGEGRVRADVHELAGGTHTEVAVTLIAERTDVRARAKAATEALLGASTRARVREDLTVLKRRLEA